MAEDSFILLNLKESKVKKLARVISNETSRKILDFLSKKEDATETEISKELGMPLSTVHYNIKHLLEAGLVKVDEFHYSEKGKAVDHYKVSNKFVIIAPESSSMQTVKEKLSKVLPAALVSLAGAGLIYFFTNMGGIAGSQMTLGAQKSGEMMEAAPEAVSAVSEPNIALWFLLGCFFMIILYLVIDFIRKRKK